MPKDLTDAVDKELPGFSLNERVEELKRKLHLRSIPNIATLPNTLLRQLTNQQICPVPFHPSLALLTFRV